MRDVFGEAKQRLAREIDSFLTPPAEPIFADPWIVSSLLQKSIRRGEVEIARRAALMLLKLRGAAIWRRLIVIAFEDIGIGNVDAVTMTVAAADDGAWRKVHGGDIRLAVAVSGPLAQAAKDRSADYLVGASDHPELADFAHTVANASLKHRLAQVYDQAFGLPQRAVATLLAMGVGARGEISGGTGPNALLAAFSDLGVPEDLLAATEIAAARTREPITVMVPLIWLAAQASRDTRVCDCPMPSLVQMSDVPLYALDMHTRLGREAIWRFAREHPAVRWCLTHYVPERCWRAVAYVAAFYVDGAPIARRLMWDQSSSLEVFGIERDLLHAGLPAEGIEPLLGVMRANLDRLNDLRRDILARSQASLVVPREVRHG